MNTRVRSIFLARSAFQDAGRDEMTIAGILHSLPINPETGTNDRCEVVIEFEEPQSAPIYIEMRLVEMPGGESVIEPSAMNFRPLDAASPSWLVWTFGSIDPQKWKVGETYAIEVWQSHGLLARRTFACVPIEELPEPRVE